MDGWIVLSVSLRASFSPFVCLSVLFCLSVPSLVCVSLSVVSLSLSRCLAFSLSLSLETAPAHQLPPSYLPLYHFPPPAPLFLLALLPSRFRVGEVVTLRAGRSSPKSDPLHSLERLIQAHQRVTPCAHECTHKTQEHGRREQHLSFGSKLRSIDAFTERFTVEGLLVSHIICTQYGVLMSALAQAASRRARSMSDDARADLRGLKCLATLRWASRRQTCRLQHHFRSRSPPKRGYSCSACCPSATHPLYRHR